MSINKINDYSHLAMAGLILMMYSASNAQSFDQCSQAVSGAKLQCREAFLSAANKSEAASGNSIDPSIASNAFTLASIANANRSLLKDATEYCETQKMLCQRRCEVGNANAMMPPDLRSQCLNAISRNNLMPESNCSPLVIQIGEQTLAFTDPRTHSVSFDILGQRAKPQPHTEIPVSWLAPESLATNYFLVLPNEQGQVLGIDQMFGNNTFGPDANSPFATNGFEALLKYDGLDFNGQVLPEAKDKRIDAKDPIFARLRLWHDLNGDGRAQVSELVQLSSVGIVSIDLKYNADYIEPADFGNVIYTKSTVDLSDGSFRPIFDVWFSSWW